MAPSSPLTAPTTTDGAAHAHQGEKHTRATHTQVRSRAYLHVFVRPAARAAACHVGPMCEGVELCGKRVRAVSGRTSTSSPRRRRIATLPEGSRASLWAAGADDAEYCNCRRCV